MDARKRPIDRQGAMEIFRSVDRIVAARGAKVVTVAIADGGVDPAALEGVAFGPTGNLRAPAIRQGRTLLVGFNEEAYRQVLS